MRLLNKVTLSSLENYIDFIVNKTELYHYPKVPGLVEPHPRLGDITIKHFSAIDVFFDKYENDRGLLNLNRFLASLYRMEEIYDELLIPEIGKITSSLNLKTKQKIALAYKFTRLLIWDLYPVIFPREKIATEGEDFPVFRKKPKYVLFDKVLIGLAMDELQPLGKKQDINSTRISEFMNVLSESILYHKEKQKQHEKSNKL